MSGYKVGKGRPPLETRFQKGNQSHLKRGKRSNAAAEHDVLRRVLGANVKFREVNKLKQRPRIEVQIKRYCASAVKGDIAAAVTLLHMHARFKEIGDLTPIILVFDAEDELV